MNRSFVWLGGVLLSGSLIWTFTPGKSTSMSTTVNTLKISMKTHCIGRMLVDLPEDVRWEKNASSATVGAITVRPAANVSRATFESSIDQRWKVLERLRADNYGNAFIRPSQRIDAADGAVIFTYEHMFVDSPVEGNIFAVAKKPTYEAEGYLWRDGTMFHIAPALNAQQEMLDLLPRLHARKPDEIPGAPGLCLDGAFVEGYYDPGIPERVTWGFQLPRRMGLVVRTESTRAPQQRMLERRREGEREMAAFISRLLNDPGTVAGRNIYREGERTVGAYVGDEFIMGGTQGEKGGDHFDTSIGAEWEYPGDAMQPLLNFGMNTRFVVRDQPGTLGAFPDAAHLPEGPSEEEFFATWDAIINSVRPLPMAFATPPAPPPPVRHPPEQAQADQRALDELIARLKKQQPTGREGDP